MKHVESKLFNQNGHFYFSFQICITCTYLTNIFGYIYIYIYIYTYVVHVNSEIDTCDITCQNQTNVCICHLPEIKF